jgi:hypothetical protein
MFIATWWACSTGLDRDPVRAGLHDEQLRIAVQLGPTTNSSASAPRTTPDFTPLRRVALATALCLGGRGQRVEQGGGLAECERSSRNLVARERGPVGGLLLVGPPEREGRGDRPRREHGDGEAHVALGHGLVHERAGHRGPLGGDPAELLRHAQGQEADLE